MPAQDSETAMAKAWVYGVSAVLLLALLASWLLNAHAMTAPWPALPSGDIFSLAYFDELLLAREGALRLDWLWERHNSVHLVVLPKLVFWLDAWLAGGQGVLTLWVAVSLQLVVAGLWVTCMARLPVAGIERIMFALLAALMLTSMVQADTLMDPINIQWAFLALGVTVTAIGLQQCVQGLRGGGGLLLLAGVLLSILSGGPVTVIALALLLTAGYSSPAWHAKAKRAAKYLLILMLGVCVQEVLRLQCLEQQQPLLLYLYLPLFPGEIVEAFSSALPQNPWMTYAYWGSAVSAFAAQFLLVPSGSLLPAFMAVMLLFMLAVLVLRVVWRSAVAPALLYTLAFAVLLALAAGVVRAYSPHAYTFRFANIGLLFLLAATCLLYAHGSRAWRVVILVLLLPYAASVIAVSYKQAGKVVTSSSRTTLSQVAYAVGSQDATAIVQSPGFYWQEESARLARQYAPAMRQAGLGVFASPGYRVYAGLQALPEKTITCRVQVHQAAPHATDPLAWHIRGEMVDERGRPMHHVLLRSDAGEAIGFGGRSQHIGRVLAQWQSPAFWSAHWKTPQAVSRVWIIGWNHDARCEPVAWARTAIAGRDH